MATTHTRLTRKELKRPDEFVTLVDRVAVFCRENLDRVVLATVATVVVFVIVFGLYFYSQHQSRLAAEAFYDAVGALEHKDYKAAELGFSRLAEGHPHTNLGRLARFYLGNAYLAKNQPAKARDALQAYLASGAQQLFRQLALTQLGVADEDLGQYRSARDAYIEAYRRFLDENPYARERADVTEALVQLGAPPEALPSRAKTLELAPSSVISPTGAVGPAGASASPRPGNPSP
jgi:tetratricopeptide (TPR) repeat protein